MSPIRPRQSDIFAGSARMQMTADTPLPSVYSDGTVQELLI